MTISVGDPAIRHAPPACSMPASDRPRRGTRQARPGRHAGAAGQSAFRFAVLVLLAVALLPAAASRALQTDPFDLTPAEDDPSDSRPGDRGGGILGVDVQLEVFGLGGDARPGSWIPVRLNVTYAGNEARNVLVVLEQPDADGDIVEVVREIALNPGNNPVLLYTLLPPATLRGSAFDVVVHELDARGDRVEQLAARRISVQNVLDPDSAVVAVVGNRSANLLDYRGPIADPNYPPTGHEFVHTLTGLTPVDLPDRWMGLDSVESLVWMDGDPTQLRGERAEALAEWVARGGHFIVVLPEFEQSWLNPANLPAALRKILPEARITRLEGQTIRDGESAGGVLRHISRYSRLSDAVPDAALPRVNLHLFEPLQGDWASSDLVPMMEISVRTRPQEGEPGPRTRRMAVAVQRAVGLGQVTLVGIPVANQALNQRQVDLPHADVFWNRILGWRADVIDAGEWDAVRQEGQQQRVTVVLDEALSQFTRLSWTASGGVLLALVVFLVYWAVSGPVAFATLRRRGRSRWSWMAFVAAAAVFTAISWAGARILRSGGIELAHFSIIDHVAHGPGYQRAVTYANVDLRGYGRRLLEVDSRPDDPEANDFPLSLDEGRLTLEAHNTIFSFAPFDASESGFPDVRRYVLDAAEPESIQPYARSTAKQVVATFVGDPMPMWNMPRPPSPDLAPQVSENDQNQVLSVSGVLVHQLPGTLVDVTVLHVTNRRARFTPRLSDQSQGATALDIYAWGLGSTGWEPGARLDLSQVCREYGPGTRAGAWVAREMRSAAGPVDAGIGFGQRDVVDAPAALMLLGLYHLIEPNDWRTPNVRQVHLARQLGRDWDLSEWLNRPCLIIMGYLQNGPPTVPLQLEGVDTAARAPESQTLVRWVYPLPAGSEPYIPLDAPRPPPPNVAPEIAPLGPSG